MKTDRGRWMGTLAAAGAAPAFADPAPRQELSRRLARIMQEPVLRADLLREPLRVESPELLRSGRHLLARMRRWDRRVFGGP